MSNIHSIGPVKGPHIPHEGVKAKPAGKQFPSFKETLSKYMAEVNEMQNKADESIEKMAAGEITDVHQVMNSVQEANLAFNMMMEIRNKVMDAYQEVMRLRL
jgi:flagellar hook-basal body complex protein FliE